MLGLIDLIRYSCLHMMIWSEAPRPRLQQELIAQCLDEQIGLNSGIRFLDALLSEVDWKPWEKLYHKSGPGRPTHHPRLMCAAIIYGLMRGFHSTRELEYATKTNLKFHWLLDARSIDHTTFAKFRTRHGDQVKELFKEINRKAAQIKKLSLEEIIIDGTRIRADSDRHGARTAAALERRLADWEEKMATALERLEKARLEGRNEEVQRYESEQNTLQKRQQQDQKALEVAKKRDEVKKSQRRAQCAWGTCSGER